MKKSKVIGTIVGIILFIGLIAGLTYAWFTWRSNNISIDGESECFNIDYTVGQTIGSNINGEDNYQKLKFTNDYTDGEYAEVSFGIDSNCTDINAVGSLYLNTDLSLTDSAILNGGLYYTVVSVIDDTETVITSGEIDNSSKLLLLDDISIEYSDTLTYRVYVWINGTVADNSYANKNYSGYISLEANSI